MEADKNWTRWVLQTAKTWEDMKFVIHETGIAHIDHEHKRMTDYMVEINKLLFELEKSFCVEVFDTQRRMMTSFYQYTATHCKNEEIFIKKYNIDGLELQQKEHKKLLSLMNEIIFQFETGRVTSAFRHRIKLLSLVVNHINTIDNKVFKYSNISQKIILADNWDDINTFIRLIHVPLIDKQHKKLTEMIIMLIKKLNETTKSRIITIEEIKFLEDVIAYSELHFRTEEAIIKKYNIPGKDIQEEQHTIFIQFLNEKLNDLKNKNIEGIEDMKERLLLWWIQHINIFDYKTFRQNDWLKKVLIESRKVEDVSWLIPRMGIESVDSDHKHFIDILFENVDIFDHSNSSNKEKRIQALNELYIYAKNHFEREETIMQTKNVLDREQHKFEHISILNSLKQFNKLNLNGKVDLSSAFKRKILKLWISHINDTDTATFGVHYD